MEPAQWVKLIREEEGRGRDVICYVDDACFECPLSDMVWEEAVRAAGLVRTLDIMDRVLQRYPHSLILWEKAVALQPTNHDKLMIYNRAVRHFPNNSDLWWSSLSLVETFNETESQLVCALENCRNDVPIALVCLGLASHRWMGGNFQNSHAAREVRRRFNALIDDFGNRRDAYDYVQAQRDEISTKYMLTGYVAEWIVNGFGLLSSVIA